MRAVLRVWWTLFTAVPLQRNFAWVGGILFGLAAVVGLFLREWFWLPLGYTAFVVFAAFPALFTAPALFRSLSAPRMFQLLPHLRLRMLIAVSLVLCALLVLSAGILVAPMFAAERAFLTAASAFLFCARRCSRVHRRPVPGALPRVRRLALVRLAAARVGRARDVRESGFLGGVAGLGLAGGRSRRVGDIRGVVPARPPSAPRDADATTACRRDRHCSTRAARGRHPHAACFERAVHGLGRNETSAPHLCVSS